MPAFDHLRSMRQSHDEAPFDSSARLIAVIAAIAGVRAGICMMAVPTLIFSVCANIQVAGVMASEPWLPPSRPSRNQGSPHDDGIDIDAGRAANIAAENAEFHVSPCSAGLPHCRCLTVVCCVGRHPIESAAGRWTEPSAPALLQGMLVRRQPVLPATCAVSMTPFHERHRLARVVLCGGGGIVGMTRRYLLDQPWFQGDRT